MKKYSPSLIAILFMALLSTSCRTYISIDNSPSKYWQGMSVEDAQSLMSTKYELTNIRLGVDDDLQPIYYRVLDVENEKIRLNFDDDLELCGITPAEHCNPFPLAEDSFNQMIKKAKEQ